MSILEVRFPSKYVTRWSCHFRSVLSISLQQVVDSQAESIVKCCKTFFSDFLLFLLNVSAGNVWGGDGKLIFGQYKHICIWIATYCSCTIRKTKCKLYLQSVRLSASCPSWFLSVHLITYQSRRACCIISCKCELFPMGYHHQHLHVKWLNWHGERATCTWSPYFC